MKKILLATTILSMSAGFAAAEVKLSGSAHMGVARDAAGPFAVYNSAAIDAAATVVSDSGVEFGMSTSVSFGHSYTFGDGDTFATEAGTLGAPKLTAKGPFGTLTFKDGGVDQLYSDGTAGDVGYTVTAGDLALGLVMDVNGDTAVGWSTSVGYTMSGVAISVALDDSSSYKASLAYTAGSITGTLGTDKASAAAAVNTLTVAYAADGMTAKFSASTAQDYSIAAGYSANGMGFDVSTNQDTEWKATASYDLGGGAKVVGGMNFTQDAYAGVDLTF